MKYALRVRAGRTASSEFAQRLEREIIATGGVVVDDDEVPPDVVLAVGGDGTMLAAVQIALHWDVPVLGFNLGTLGFLAEAEPDNVGEVVRRLSAGDFSITERLTVSASVDQRVAVGINDVVVEKIDSTRLVTLVVEVDGTEFTTYRADGLIVATPTGSTAYSFSAGGPVMAPRIDAFVLTPVAAHSLFDRPVVLPASAEIAVTVRGDRQVRVNVDKTGLGDLADGETVKISRGDRPVRFVTFNSMSFAGLVRDKFRLE